MKTIIALLFLTGCAPHADEPVVYRTFGPVPPPYSYAAIKYKNKIYGFCFPVLKGSKSEPGYNIKFTVNSGQDYFCTLKAGDGSSLVMSEEQYLKEAK